MQNPIISEPLKMRSQGFYVGLDLGQAADYTALAPPWLSWRM